MLTNCHGGCLLLGGHQHGRHAVPAAQTLSHIVQIHALRWHPHAQILLHEHASLTATDFEAAPQLRCALSRPGYQRQAHVALLLMHLRGPHRDVHYLAFMSNVYYLALMSKVATLPVYLRCTGTDHQGLSQLLRSPAGLLKLPVQQGSS